MFLIFKPPQSYLQVQLLDPDGYNNRSTLEEQLYEAQLVEKILKERKRKQDKKLKSARLKKKIKQKIEAGASAEEVSQIVAKEVLSLEERFPFTEERKASVDKVLKDYEQQLQAQLDAAIEQYYSMIKAEYDLGLELYAEQQARIASAKRKKLLRDRRIKVLLLLTQMEDE